MTKPGSWHDLGKWGTLAVCKAFGCPFSTAWEAKENKEEG